MRHKTLVPAQLQNTKSDILEFKYFNTNFQVLQIVLHASNYQLITEYLRAASSYRISVENILQPLVIYILDKFASLSNTKSVQEESVGTSDKGVSIYKYFSKTRH